MAKAAPNPNYDELLSQRHYRNDYEPKPEEVLLTIAGKTVGTAGNFVVFSGLPKAGKSTFIHATIASVDVPARQIFQISLKKTIVQPHYGLFDTESAEYDFYRNLGRIKAMTGTKLNPYFNAFNTRQDSSELNKILVEAYITNYKPSVVIIDGLLDLIKNYNDEIESRQLIDWLKAITANNKVLIIGVIHTGKKDNHTLGHFGSMADRYAQSVLEIIKDRENGTYQLSAKYLRSDTEFEPISIMWSGSQYVECAFPPPSSQKETASGKRRR